MNLRSRSARTRRRAVLGLAAWLVGLLALGGCMMGPEYQRPEVRLNDAWQGKVAEPREPQSVRWWESFNDPTLSALVQSAYEQNLTLRAAGLRVLEARAARGIAVGEFFPQLQEAVGGIDANQISVNEVGGVGDRSFATDFVGLQAAWELDFWGKFRRGIEAADAELLATVADYDAVLLTLQADVAATYLLLRSQQERLDYARRNVALQLETLDLTRKRLEAGSVSELDVSTARSTLATTRAFIPQLENFLRKATLSLCVLLGRAPSDLAAELTPPGGASPRLPDPPAGIALGIPADLLRRRPDVRAAERFAAAESARIGQAVTDLYPQISISGSTGFVSSTWEAARRPDLGNIFDANSFAGFIGLQVNWPILNYGRIKGSIQVQDARYEQAVATYQESVLRAAGDVEAGLSDFLRLKERAEHLRESVAASKRSTELSLIQYRAGAVDYIRVNDAQTRLVEQEDELVVSRAVSALGAVRTYRALGGGWEIRAGQEFVDPETGERMRERTDWGDVMLPNWDEGNDLGFERPATDAATSGEKK